ncbi:MAG: hypothetical protein ACR2NJ_08320 [Acidimicrobiales bacterium]
MSALFSDLAHQAPAVEALRAAARRPVHAYLLLGPAGVGKAAAARGFAAALLCEAGGDGTCEVCRRVLNGTHPDVVEVEREGQVLTVGAAHEVIRAAMRSPVEGRRKVLILPELHLARDAGPALLKIVEEPPASTVFVITAEHVPPELLTVASRCVTVEFSPLRPSDLAELLVAEGVEPERAAALAEAAGGRIDRAKLLASDPGFSDRQRAWRSLPSRLDGTGATVARLVDELLELLDSSVVPLEAQHQRETEALLERNDKAVAVNAKAGRSARAASKAGVKELEERRKRELRRQRTDELKAGLAALAAAYRRDLVDPRLTRRCVAAIEAIQALAANLAYNPGEQLALQALLIRLDRLGT